MPFVFSKIQDFLKVKGLTDFAQGHTRDSLEGEKKTRICIGPSRCGCDQNGAGGGFEPPAGCDAAQLLDTVNPSTELAGLLGLTKLSGRYADEHPEPGVERLAPK